jgi:hypothetical protein
MFVPRLPAIALALVATLGLSACYEDGYGYGGLSVGYGDGYYGSPYYGGYGGYPYYGWYDGFYYPGTGYYVYDRHGSRHRWNDDHRRHWQDRAHNWRGDRRSNWDGMRDRRGGRYYPGNPRVRDSRTESRPTIREQRQERRWSVSPRGDRSRGDRHRDRARPD